ncbi:MAG: TetR family transcriptional regulator, partial [Bacteroidetes bacterium]
HVLDQIMMLFWQRGYQATSIHDLLDHTGLSRASLYHAFGDKRELYVRSLHRYQEQMALDLDDALMPSRPLREQVRALFRQRLAPQARMSSPPGCLLINASTEMSTRDTGISQLLTEMRQGWQVALSRAMARGQAQGELSYQYDPEALARALFLTYSGLMVQIRQQGELGDWEEVLDIALSVLDA